MARGWGRAGWVARQGDPPLRGRRAGMGDGTEVIIVTSDEKLPRFDGLLPASSAGVTAVTVVSWMRCRVAGIRPGTVRARM